MLEWLKAVIRESSIFNFNHAERSKWVERQARLLPTGTRLLDVGTGSSPFRKFFPQCEYKTQDFCQLTPDQLLGHKGYGPVDYVCDITSIPVPEGSFDAVLCTEVIEHVPDPIKALSEMSRVLKHGGKLILTAPLGSGLHQEPHHYYGGYTPWFYKRVLPELGMELSSIEANGGFFKFYGQESIRLARVSSPARFQGPLILKLIMFPFWLLSLPTFAIIIPIVCHFLDRFDKTQDFTIGYQVVAIKK